MRCWTQLSCARAVLSASSTSCAAISLPTDRTPCLPTRTPCLPTRTPCLPTRTRRAAHRQSAKGCTDSHPLAAYTQKDNHPHRAVWPPRPRGPEPGSGSCGIGTESWIRWVTSKPSVCAYARCIEHLRASQSHSLLEDANPQPCMFHANSARDSCIYGSMPRGRGMGAWVHACMGAWMYGRVPERD